MATEIRFSGSTDKPQHTENTPNMPLDYPTARPEDPSDEQLAWIIMNSREYAALKEEESRNGGTEGQRADAGRAAEESQSVRPSQDTESEQ